MSAGRTRLVLVDTPELWDEDGVENVELLKDCLALALPGPHFFLLVLQVGRFTQGESETLGPSERVVFVKRFSPQELQERNKVIVERKEGAWRLTPPEERVTPFIRHRASS